MKEFNNREVAKQYAEYITGDELRRYVAKKVHSYIKNSMSVFDGACGSGQLCQYVNLNFLTGVEIQKGACDTCKENYPNSEIHNTSFFEFNKGVVEDIVIMNPPFSLKFKDLSDIEQENIKKEFHWKKSGVVDDIFILKSLKHTKRYGFYIMFPGIAYRKSEVKLRELIGNNLLELNVIENAFKDTNISVLFLVIDKEKKENSVSKEIYDCKTKKVLYKETGKIVWQCWETPKKEIEREEIDIDEVNRELDILTINHLKKHITSLKMRIEFFGESEKILSDFKDTVYKILANS